MKTINAAITFLLIVILFSSCNTPHGIDFSEKGAGNEAEAIISRNAKDITNFTRITFKQDIGTELTTKMGHIDIDYFKPDSAGMRRLRILTFPFEHTMNHTKYLTADDTTGLTIEDAMNLKDIDYSIIDYNIKYAKEKITDKGNRFSGLGDYIIMVNKNPKTIMHLFHLRTDAGAKEEFQGLKRVRVNNYYEWQFVSDSVGNVTQFP